ncbi:MAG: heterodisulfide reductase-related iron-sulfur binding cluster [Anaerolineae bacterium]
MTTDPYLTKLQQCIHCGLCLEACPTYAVFGTEMDAPRGRIALMRAAAEGRIAPAAYNGAFATHLNRCLACRACETACPSGVQYGSLIETARNVIEQQRTPGAGERLLRWLGLRQLMPHRGRLRLLARLLKLVQASGLQGLVRRANALPKTLAAMDDILPPLQIEFGGSAPAPAIGPQRGRVAFFTGCVQDAFLSPVNAATVRVLQRNGFEVHFVPAQTCCGAAHAHSGEPELARELARRNIDAFLAGQFDAVLNNAGGCGLMLKEYPHLLADDPAYAGRARQFAAAVQDITQFLADNLHTPPQKSLNLRVTYADSCHLRHGQKVVQPPRHLLRQIPGLALVELKQPDRCCGSAGVYNIAQPDTAALILDDKMADIAATGAQVVATSNTGCHMQLIAGVRRAGLNARVLHVVQLLDEAYDNNN